MKQTNIKEDDDRNGTRVPTSTSLEERYMERVERLAKKDLCSNSSIIRKCVIRHLPELEKEILGEEFVGGVKPVRKPVKA